MEAGWTLLAGPAPLSVEALDDYARERGGRLFAFGARLLGGDPDLASEGGETWALVDLARRSSNAAEAAAALAAARARAGPGRWPGPLRPLGMLASLARRDAVRGEVERQGSPARIWLMLRHRITGG
jgi:phytoene synthase